MRATKIPLLIVVPCVEGTELEAMFSARGFRCLEPSSPIDRQTVATLAIVAVDQPGGAALVRRVSDAGIPIVAIDPSPGGAVALATTTVHRPYDPAWLFALVVKVIASQRRSFQPRPATRQARLTGVIGPVRGNPLFEKTVRVLEHVVAAVNAGAILEDVLEHAGSSPHQMNVADLAAILLSDRLRAALDEFATEDVVGQVLDRLRSWLPCSGAETDRSMVELAAGSRRAGTR
jgi:hypothetical protein